MQSVESYIIGLDAHHRTKTFREEFESILLESGHPLTKVSEIIGEENR